jgi:Mn2+/Fe2+ NRAMP family transporter
VPLWLVVLWWVFAAAIYRSFAKLGQTFWVAAVLGGIAVPFNYMVGAGLGAVTLPLGERLSVVILVVVWAVLLPLLYRISHRMTEAQ